MCNNPLCRGYVHDLYSLLVILGFYGEVNDYDLHGKYYLERALDVDQHLGYEIRF